VSPQRIVGVRQTGSQRSIERRRVDRAPSRSV